MKIQITTPMMENLFDLLVFNRYIMIENFAHKDLAVKNWLETNLNKQSKSKQPVKSNIIKKFIILTDKIFRAGGIKYTPKIKLIRINLMKMISTNKTTNNQMIKLIKIYIKSYMTEAKSKLKILKAKEKTSSNDNDKFKIYKISYIISLSLLFSSILYSVLGLSVLGSSVVSGVIFSLAAYMIWKISYIKKSKSKPAVQTTISQIKQKTKTIITLISKLKSKLKRK